MALLELKNVSRGYGQGIHRSEVLADIDLEVDDGEFVAIVGFSGSGKTTLISLIAGLLAPDAGEILLAGEPVTGPGPERGLVFQNYSLLPWLTVHGNVELGVRQAFPHLTRAERASHVDKYVELVNLSAAAQKRPGELSGGMRQRVSLARGLAIEPEILLLDEPLSALDALTRGTLQAEIARIWNRDRKTVLMITNDVDEAVLLADRIIPLKPGPRATLGPAFPVRLQRPRDRKALNHDPEFKKIRGEVTNYLIEIGRSAKAERRVVDVSLPELQPANLRPPTRAYWR